MIRSLIFGVACLTLAACEKPPKEVPVLVAKPIPVAPAECTTSSPNDLAPMPSVKRGDTLESYLARVAKNHRVNRITFRKVKSEKTICGVYTNNLAKQG